jgi:hypothetical protein
MSFRDLALLGLSSLALSAHGQSQFRLYGEAYGGYYNYVQTTSPVFGLDTGGNPNTVYGTLYYGSDYKSADAFDQTTPLPNVTAGGVWAGDASQGMTPVTSNAYGMTNWGSNHASASLSGFTQVNQSYNGQFVVGANSWPMHVDSTNYSYATGRSIWEELYQIGGGTGTGQFTGTIHIDGTLAATAGSGNATIDWSLKTFSNQLVASVYASYDAGADSWNMGVFSNGQWTNTSGTGTLTINEDVIGGYSFTYGAALYLKSDLLTSVSGNAAADFSNTVQFTGMILPQGSTVYVLSGASAADYGISFGGNGSGTICQNLACAAGGGGGLPIPEPETYALLLSGLGVIAWVARRRGRR